MFDAVIILLKVLVFVLNKLIKEKLQTPSKWKKEAKKKNGKKKMQFWVEFVFLIAKCSF